MLHLKLSYLFVSLLGAVFILLFHFSGEFDTMLNQWDYGQNLNKFNIDTIGLKEAVAYHKLEPSFARRTLTTSLIETFSALTKHPIAISFISIQFFLWFVTGLFVAKIGTYFTFSQREKICSQILFFTSFSILCCFFNTNYTYDEPLQYVALYSSLLFHLQKKRLYFLLSFWLACVCRESSYLFAILFIIDACRNNREQWKLKVLQYGFLYLIVLIAHALFIYFMYPAFYFGALPTELNSRLSLIHFNFQHSIYVHESIVSILLVYLFPFTLLLIHLKEIKNNAMEKHWLHYFLLLVVMNSAIVYTSAFARETRLLALPLILMFPLLGKYLHVEVNSLFNGFTFKKLNFQMALDTLAILVFIYASFYYLYHVYTTSIEPPELNCNREYLFASVCISVLLLWKKRNTYPKIIT